MHQVNHFNLKYITKTRPGGYKAFFILNQMSITFQMLIKTKMLKNKDISCFQTLRCIYHANKC